VAEVSSTEANGGGDVVTWHHGLMARWWANFNLDGPEIEYFRRFVEADMIACCWEAAERVGRSPALYVQPLHRLDLPRRYRSIVVCGGFGLGATRTQDVQGLRRLFGHLEPGGLLALDYAVEELDTARRREWHPAAADLSPPAPADRRLGTDGFEYTLRHRVVAFDHDTRQMTREMQAWQWSDGDLVAHETHALVANLYTACLGPESGPGVNQFPDQNEVTTEAGALSSRSSPW
jgi:hypothetical protein